MYVELIVLIIVNNVINPVNFSKINKTNQVSNDCDLIINLFYGKTSIATG